MQQMTAVIKVQSLCNHKAILLLHILHKAFLEHLSCAVFDAGKMVNTITPQGVQHISIGSAQPIGNKRGSKK
jgi:hypothetical protein